MTVYVDDWRQRAEVGRLNAIWCHLFVAPEDEIAELHQFAARIGLTRSWFQGAPKHPWPRSHYDVTEGKRWQAIRAGAAEITWREGGQMLLNARPRRLARAVELATGLGHDINEGENRWECSQCLQLAIRRNLAYGLAATEACRPARRPWHERPEGLDATCARAGHMPRASWE